MTRIEAGLILIGVDFHSSRFAFNDSECSTPARARLRVDVPRPGDSRSTLHRPRRHRARDRRQDLALEDGRADDRLAGLGSSLRRCRLDPAEGRDPGRLRDDAVRRRTASASGTRPASCTRRCCNATSPWRGCSRTWRSPVRGSTSRSPSTTATTRLPRWLPGLRCSTRPERQPDTDACQHHPSTRSSSAAATTVWSTARTSPSRA